MQPERLSIAEEHLKTRPFAIERWLDVHEGAATHSIAESCARPLALAEPIRLVSSAGIRPDVRLGYGPSPGRADLRAALVRLYPGARAEDVFVSIGTIEASSLALSALSEPGDRVVAMAPTYQQLHEIPRAQGTRVDYWPPRPEANWRPDLDDLRHSAEEIRRYTSISSAALSEECSRRAGRVLRSGVALPTWPRLRDVDCRRGA